MQNPKLPAKKACILKPAYGLLSHHRLPVQSWKRPKVIVDWHNTLELNDQVPPTHDKALDALLEKADVYMLSFCGKDRKEMAPVLEKIFGVTMTPAEQKMIACVTSLGKLVQLWDESGTFPTEESFALALSLGKGFLDDYQWLNQWSKDCGRKSFHIVHKHHSFMHLLYNSRYMNPPKARWCFKAEDYVRHISRTHSISMGVRSTKLSQKLCPKYRVLLHLLLTRAGFAQECHKVLE